jgi:DNA-binding beta-propeller fold protein YncE
MHARATFSTALVFLLVTVAAVVSVARQTPPPAPRPGPLGHGVTLLPNGWRIQPAGVHLAIGDLPLAMTLSPDGHSLIVTNNGYQKPTLRVVNLDHHDMGGMLPMDDAWLGLAWSPDGKTLYSSGAASSTVQAFSWANQHLRAGPKIDALKDMPALKPGETRPVTALQTFVGGIAVSRDGSHLFAVHVFGQLVTSIDLAAGAVSTTVKLPAEPYACLLSPDGRTLYVSLWGGARVMMFDTATLAPRGEVGVGEHPNAMAFSADGTRLFVACANTNAVWVIDLAKAKAIEQISISLYPDAPAGSTPNALAVSPDGQRLLVANADNNAVAMVDISHVGESRVLGFIPTGWYPTGVLFSHDGSEIYVLSGKGLTSSANPRGAQPGIPTGEGQYSGSMLEGSLSIVPAPSLAALAAYTKTVLDLTPYSDATRLAPASAPGSSPIPRRVGDVSAIKHVFYVIRENRTYDQILGDLDRGNGDPTLALFGETITPNAHELAREFVTLDNFYVDAEVSYSGHAFSTAAYSTDVVEKIWPTNYGGRGGPYLSEGGGKMRNPFGNLAAPAQGYLWDTCQRAGKSFRSYGEFAELDTMTGEMKATVPGLEGHVHPKFPTFDLKIKDQARLDIWLDEFHQFEGNGQLPALSIVRLPNDHTNGTRPGAHSPRAMVADNDLALGRLVEAVSHSVYWPESAIFVLEDDSQNGPDHVDAHRSVGFVISPLARRNAVDSTLYSTSGMLRTMELVLGLPPMTQYDAAATPMYNAFTTTPALAAYTAKPAIIDLSEMNRSTAPGAAASARMDFSKEDMTPEIELNEILWQSIHGAGAVMPPPVHAAFVRPQPVVMGDEDDAPKVRPTAPTTQGSGPARRKPGLTP